MLSLSELQPLCPKWPQDIGKREEGTTEGQPVPMNGSRTESSCDDKECTEKNLYVLSSGRGVYVSGLVNHTCMSMLLDTAVTWWCSATTIKQASPSTTSIQEKRG